MREMIKEIADLSLVLNDQDFAQVDLRNSMYLD